MSEEKDYISHLPDSIIHHILSFLPSTKQAIRTGVLSKMWKNQWTHVPVLVFKTFDFINEPYTSSSMTMIIIENILSLHRCPRIEKFECFFEEYEEHQLSSVIGFAAKRNVEELILRNIYRLDKGSLPKLHFHNASPVELRLYNFQFELNGRVKWECLKILKLERCELSAQGIENALSGSPVLETLELIKSYWHDRIVIASKSLQNVFLHDTDYFNPEILCPNLRKLKCIDCLLRGQVIQHISSSNPLLESLELERCYLFCLEQPAISSKSLKRSVLDRNSFYDDDDNSMLLSEIVCPKLERLEISGTLDFLSCAVLNFSSLDCAYLNIRHSRSRFDNLLQQLNDEDRWAIRVIDGRSGWRF